MRLIILRSWTFNNSSRVNKPVEPQGNGVSALISYTHIIQFLRSIVANFMTTHLGLHEFPWILLVTPLGSLINLRRAFVSILNGGCSAGAFSPEVHDPQPYAIQYLFKVASQGLTFIIYFYRKITLTHMHACTHIHNNNNICKKKNNIFSNSYGHMGLYVTSLKLPIGAFTKFSLYWQ